MESSVLTSVTVTTPEEELAPPFSTKKEQVIWKTSTKIQVLLLFLQICLITIFMFAVMAQKALVKDTASPKEIIVIAFGNETKHGMEYRNYEEIIEQSVQEVIDKAHSTEDESSITVKPSSDDDDEKPSTTKMVVLQQPETPIASPLQKVSPIGTTIITDVSRPAPPVPPPRRYQPASRSPPLKTTGRQRTKAVTQRITIDFIRG